MIKLFLSRVSGCVVFWIALIYAGQAAATTYWVSTDGNDSNDCASESQACRTIGQGVALALAPGDIVNIKGGTYNTAHPGCKFWSVEGIACAEASGTADKPITIQAAPGHEGDVILDGGGVLFGIQLETFDYITIQNLEIANMQFVGIVSFGSQATRVSATDESKFSVGVKILNNYIHDIHAVNSGRNPAGIRMDTSKDWLVSNNRIETVCGNDDEGGCRYVNAGCIYSYYIWNATVTNNECTNSGAGVHWKDHILDENGNPTHTGSVVKYNLAHDVAYGFYISHGNRDPQSSNHTVTHNIFYNVQYACMSLKTDTENDAQSVNYVFDHNICDNAEMGIYSSYAQVMSATGNIYSDITGYPQSRISDVYRFQNNPQAKLEYADYNVFEPSFARANMSDPTADFYVSNLSDWQNFVPNLTKGGLTLVSLNDTNPDANSIEVSSEDQLFMDVGARDYRPAASAKTLGMMPDGSNVGAYQYGDEVIGLLPTNTFESRLSPISKLPPVSVRVAE